MAFTNSLGDFVKHSLMVFSFWFIIGGILALAYSEVVTRVYTLDLDGDSDEEDPDLETRRLVPWQILGVAVSVATSVLMTRWALEAVCANFGREACGVLSGVNGGEPKPSPPEVDDFPPPPEPPAVLAAAPTPAATPQPTSTRVPPPATL